jgi:hypothetical protein
MLKFAFKILNKTGLFLFKAGLLELTHLLIYSHAAVSGATSFFDLVKREVR